MTKKSKQDPLTLLNRHQSQRVRRIDDQQVDGQSIKNHVSNKKSIKKMDQPFQIIDKVQFLKERAEKFYKSTEKKIDRMIEIIQQIEEKKLLPFLNDMDKLNGDSVNHGKNPEKKQFNNTVEEKQIVNKTLTHIHNILTYEKPLTHIKHEFESFYAKLSCFSKDLLFQKPLPNDKKFLIPQKQLTFEQLKNIQQIIKEHYLRTGNFKAAKLFNRYGKNTQDIQTLKEQIAQQKPIQINLQKRDDIKDSKKKSPKKSPTKKKPKAQLIDEQQNFKECFLLKNQILKNVFEEAINWCVQQRLYETYTNPLEYNLRIGEIKLLIFEKKFQAAFKKIKSNFQKFYNNYQKQINSLVTFLWFSCQWSPESVFTSESNQSSTVDNSISSEQKSIFEQMIKNKYSQFDISTVKVEQLAQRFIQTYFIHYNISRFDAMKICYEVGNKYQQKYFDSIKMFSQKDRQEFLKHRNTCELNDKQTKSSHPILLPFEIPADKQYMYHSIFVCPVTKQVLSSNDGVEFLTCGHLVSESAKKSMAEVRRSNHRHKCPVCQKDRAGDVIKVRF